MGILINIILILGALTIAYFAFQKESKKEKIEEAEKRDLIKNRDKQFDKITKSYDMQYISLPDDDIFPSFEKHGFEFADLAWYAKDEPPTPPLPKLSLKRQIISGDYVRLGLIFEEEGEPTDILVEVSEHNKEDIFSGIILWLDDPTIETLKGLKINLHANHIAEIVSNNQSSIH